MIVCRGSLRNSPKSRVYYQSHIGSHQKHQLQATHHPRLLREEIFYIRSYSKVQGLQNVVHHFKGYEKRDYYFIGVRVLHSCS